MIFFSSSRSKKGARSSSGGLNRLPSGSFLVALFGSKNCVGSTKISAITAPGVENAKSRAASMPLSTLRSPPPAP